MPVHSAIASGVTAAAFGAAAVVAFGASVVPNTAGLADRLVCGVVATEALGVDGTDKDIPLVTWPPKPAVAAVVVVVGMLMGPGI